MNNFMYEKYWRVKRSLCAFDGTGYRHKENVNIDSVKIKKEQICVNRSVR